MDWTSPAWMWPLLLVVAAGALLWTVASYRRTLPQVSGTLTRVLIVLRSTTFLILILALAGPIVSHLRSQLRPAEVVVVIEDSQSMGLAGAAPVGAQSRWQHALLFAAGIDSALAVTGQKVDLILIRGNGIAPLRELHRDDPVVPAPLAQGTDLASLLRQTTARLAGHPARATVIFSDGQETVPNTGRSGAEGAPHSGELFVVGVGDPTGPPDRLLKDVRYPESAYAGDELVVEFAVDHRYQSSTDNSDRKRPVTARLRVDGRVVAEETIVSGQNLVPFELSFKTQKAGLQLVELEVDVLDNERFPENNHMSLAVNIRKERAQVLLLAASAAWDVRFLAQAAADEERLALSVVYPGANGLVYADSLKPWTPPGDAAGWLQWDAVILTGWNGALSGIDWPLLAEAVRGGLGLLIDVGGTTDRQGRPVSIAPPAALMQVMPVSVRSWRWRPGPLFVRASSASRSHPILGGIGLGRPDGRGSSLDVRGMPPLAQIAPVELRDQAEVILTARSLDSPVEHILLAVDARESGRVVWFGGARLWELAFWAGGRRDREAEPDGSVGRRLVRNIMVWLAAGEEDAGLVFTGGQSLFHEGESIKLSAEWRDIRGQVVAGRQVKCVLRTIGSDSLAERTFPVDLTGGAEERTEVAIPPLAPGRYFVQLIAEGDPPVSSKPRELVVGTGGIEKTQLRLNRRRLQHLATRSGGRFYEAGKTGQLDALYDDLQRLDWQGERLVRRYRFDLRKGWPLLGLVVVLLGAEWFLRRRHGLL